MFAGCFDFSIGAGWHKIVDELCQKLQQISDASGVQLEVHQVKEKFSTLRFYVGAATEEQYALIDAAESECDKTCEVCGEPGTERTEGWMKILCDTHDQERQARK